MLSLLITGFYPVLQMLTAYRLYRFAIKVAAIGIELFVQFWNEHPISGI